MQFIFCEICIELICIIYFCILISSAIVQSISSLISIVQCGRTEHIAANYANDSRTKRWLHIGISVDGHSIMILIRNEY